MPKREKAAIQIMAWELSISYMIAECSWGNTDQFFKDKYLQMADRILSFEDDK